MEKVTINTDGGARGNPGKAACAFVISFGDGGEIQTIKESFYLGHSTNNVAEYMGVLKAYEKLLTLFPNATRVTLQFFLDSELVVKQLTGIYKIKNENLFLINKKIHDLEKNFGSVNYQHVRREQNKDADRLVNICLDENF